MTLMIYHLVRFCSFVVNLFHHSRRDAVGRIYEGTKIQATSDQREIRNSNRAKKRMGRSLRVYRPNRVVDLRSSDHYL